MTGELILLSDRTADAIVSVLDDRRKAALALRRHPDYRGPANKRYRDAKLREERELDLAISAINTGRGITRATAVDA